MTILTCENFYKTSGWIASKQAKGSNERPGHTASIHRAIELMKRRSFARMVLVAILIISPIVDHMFFQV
jgi:hypothetical protein